VVKVSVKITDIKFIPKEQVPKKERRTRWDEIFKAIPKGKAAVFTESQVSPSSARQALQRQKRKGFYKHLNVIIEGKKGQRTIYIVNNEE